MGNNQSKEIRFAFLQLPIELRLEVYEWVFANMRFKIPPRCIDHERDVEALRCRQEVHSIFRVNKQVLEESLWLFYKRSRAREAIFTLGVRQQGCPVACLQYRIMATKIIRQNIRLDWLEHITLRVRLIQSSQTGRYLTSGEATGFGVAGAVAVAPPNLTTNEGFSVVEVATLLRQLKRLTIELLDAPTAPEDDADDPWFVWYYAYIDNQLLSICSAASDTVKTVRVTGVGKEYDQQNGRLYTLPRCISVETIDSDETIVSRNTWIAGTNPASHAFLKRWLVDSYGDRKVAVWVVSLR